MHVFTRPPDNVAKCLSRHLAGDPLDTPPRRARRRRAAMRAPMCALCVPTASPKRWAHIGHAFARRPLCAPSRARARGGRAAGSLPRPRRPDCQAPGWLCVYAWARLPRSTRLLLARGPAASGPRANAGHARWGTWAALIDPLSLGAEPGKGARHICREPEGGRRGFRRVPARAGGAVGPTEAGGFETPPEDSPKAARGARERAGRRHPVVNCS